MRTLSLIPEHILRITNGGKTGISDNQLPECFAELFTNLKHEQMYLLLLSHIRHYISLENIASGGPEMIKTNYSIIYDKVSFYNAKYVAIAHNHTANKYPSVEDIIFTRQVADTLSKNGVYLMDHIIFFNGTALSMKNKGYI